MIDSQAAATAVRASSKILRTQSQPARLHAGKTSVWSSILGSSNYSFPDSGCSKDRTAFCRRPLCLFRSAFSFFFLLTPFCLSPLLFLALHFLLALFECDAHGVSSGCALPFHS